MGSTITGNAGASANGQIVTLVPVDSRGALLVTNGVPSVPQQNIVGTNGGNASGVYSFSGLAAGYYNLSIASSGSSAPWPITQVLTQNNIYVDGSSTYHL